tara:strand:+ start:498 stop:629 length:132 start_codon:yes stop_codon:yes gene_type:complete
MDMYHRSEYQRTEAIETQFQILVDELMKLKKRVDKLELQQVLQ